jgi:hypothetical protein
LAPALALAGWCAFAWYVFWQGTVGEPVIWFDSKSYAVVAGHPLWSTGFWAGQRPPLAPLALKLVGSSTGFTSLQSLVAVAAWGLLAFTVGRLVPGGWRRVAAVWIVLAFASSTPVILWNRSVLSESLSLSILAVLVAATIWTALRITWPRVTVVVLTSLAFAATRDAQVWTVGLLGLAVVVAVAVHGRRHRRLSRHGVVLAAGLLLASGLTGWDTTHTGRTNQNVANVLFVRVFPFPGRVSWFSDHGMPEAKAIDRLAAGVQPANGAAKVVGLDLTDPANAPLERWIVDHGQSTYLLWLMTHPAYVISEPLERPERAFNFANGSLTFYAATGRVDSPLTPVMWPAWWWLLPLSVIGFGAAAVTGRWRERSGQAVALLAALGLLSMLIAWQGDGQEVTRHTIEGFVELRAAVLIIFAVGVLRIDRSWVVGARRTAWAGRRAPEEDAGSRRAGAHRDDARNARRRYPAADRDAGADGHRVS